MKHKHLFLLSVALLISGCNVMPITPSIEDDSSSIVDTSDTPDSTTISSKSTSKTDPKPSSTYSIPVQENEVHIKAFDPTDTDQVSNNCKDYIDAMRKQADSLGEQKYIMRTDGMVETKDKDVDIRNYKDTSNVMDEKSDRSKGVTLTFEPDKGYEANEYCIKISTVKDFNGGDLRTLHSAAPSGTTVYNLLQNTTYYWRVEGDNGAVSEVKSFTTGDYVRWIKADKMYNIRDCGGYMTSYGKRIKQGMIFRGGEISKSDWNQGATKHYKTFSDESMRVFRDEVKMKVELDFRNDMQRENGSYNSCAFASNNDINWVNITQGSWANGLNNDRAKIKQIFEYFANADKGAVYYHCHGGADRTGTIGFLLQGVLGCSYSDILIDYELTTYSSINDGNNCTRTHIQKGVYDDWPGLIKTITSYNGSNGPKWVATDPLKDNIERFLVEGCKVSEDTIDKLREIMLED